MYMFRIVGKIKQQQNKFLFVFFFLFVFQLILKLFELIFIVICTQFW